MFKQMREPVNGLTHYFAALAAMFGLVVLLMISRGDFLKQETLLVYGSSLVLMLMASASYHLIKVARRRIEFLRKIDHSAIFILIAGTYTPICANLMSGFWQWGMLLVIWALALVGTISKVLLINTPRWFTAAVYVVMGWLGLLAANQILAALPPGALILLVLGGLVFTFGAFVYATKTMNFVPGVFGFHEVWHIFVIVGCLCHFILMLVYIAPVTRA
ncbi:MAG: hemolysin III family protein [Chloroflexi bacterium]|nr:hemolysin III family protein [Chloroflexota bacterium]